MKYVKEYLCDKRTPSDEEIKECLEIVSKEDCVVIKLVTHNTCSICNAKDEYVVANAVCEKWEQDK